MLNSFQFIFQFLMQEKVKIVTLKDTESGTEDKYALSNQPIGEGKYAKVYKAQNIRNPHKLFAVKVIKLASEQVRKEYLKELSIIKNLPDCPNLVKTHKQHLQSQNNLYIFQEYCESGTLMSYRTQKQGAPLSQDQIYDLFFQVCNGTITLLDAGIVHEDIKPVNILKKGRIFKLCDFGVSQFQSEVKETTTRKGTISYMPPEKLKSRKFLPNQKSDIFSLGVCLYQIIFGFHPYLKKKTANYKQYLLAIQQATLRPISILMKKIGSSTLRLQNFLRFLERMIDLNQKTRVNLSQLKDFIKTTQPFKLMSPIIEQKSQNEKIESTDRESYGQNFKMFYQSVVQYKKQNHDSLCLTSNKPTVPKQQSEQMLLQQSPPQKTEQDKKRKIFIDNVHLAFFQEDSFFVQLIGYLTRGIDNIRKCNFNSLNVTPVQKNITNLDLKDCMLSRYLKYLIFQFCLGVKKRQFAKYEEFISEQAQDKLRADISYLNNQFNKFLIESNFKNKQSFGDELNTKLTLQLWRQISNQLSETLKTLSMVKENKKDFLLSIIYCIFMPKLLEYTGKIKSIMSDERLQNLITEDYLNDNNLEQAKILLNSISEIQRQKPNKIRDLVQKELERKQIMVLFEFSESSTEIQIIEEKDLV